MRALLVLALGMIGIGCAPMYLPNPVNTPFHEEQGDTELRVAVSHFLPFSVDVQGATALTDHMSLMVNVALANHDYSDDEPGAENEYFRHRLYEAGLGYYGRLPRSRFYGVYGGASYGWSKVDYAHDYGYFFGLHKMQGEGRYVRYFLQGHVGTSGPWFGATLAMRLSLVDFTYYVLNEETHVTKPVVYIDPALMVWLGGPHFQFFGQLQTVRPLTSSDEQASTVSFLTLGLRARFRLTY